MTPQQRHQFDTARLEARRHGKQARHHARLRAQQIIQEIRAELDQQKETTMPESAPATDWSTATPAAPRPTGGEQDV